jgi:hypothetical protein
MKNFKQIKEKLESEFILERRDSISVRIRDQRSAELFRKEILKFTTSTGGPKAEVHMERSGGQYVIEVTPKTVADEKIIKTFIEDAGLEVLKNEFITSMKNSIREEESFLFTTHEGDDVLVTPQISKKIVEIHDTLNDVNQEIFLEMIVHGKETFNQATSFCESYSRIQE